MLPHLDPENQISRRATIGSQASLTPKPDLPFVSNPGRDPDLQHPLSLGRAEAQLPHAAEDGIAEIDRHLGLNIGTPLGSPHIGAATPAPSAEEVFEIELDVATTRAAPAPAAEDVPEVESPKPANSLGRRLISLRVEALPKPRLAELVI